jgi:hypothetical protein
MNDKLPPGILAMREYRVLLPSGPTATIGFALSDFAHNSEPADVARRNKAVAFGLLAIHGVPDAPERAMVWFHDSTRLRYVLANGDPHPSDEIRRILPRYFAVFFNEIRDVAPSLAALIPVVPRIGDKNRE